MSKSPNPTDRLRREPSAPIGMLLALALAPLFAFYVFADVPEVQRLARRFTLNATALLGTACVVAVLALVLMLGDFVRNMSPPPMRLALRIVRSIAYGWLLVLALGFSLQAQDRHFWDSLHADHVLQAKVSTAFVFGVAAAYLFSQHAWFPDRTAAEYFPPYQNVVASLRNCYDFVLGVEYPNDIRNAQVGARAWRTLPEKSLYTNLFVVGGTGGGKTTRFADPLMQQAMSKFPDDPSMQPSMLIMDLKGNNALRIYEYAKKFGREKHVWIVALGNTLGKNPDGSDVVPADRFITWNPIGGTEPADVRALRLSEAFETAQETPSHEYFRNVQNEFLSATVQVFDSVVGVGNVTLYDLYLFALDETKRADTIARARKLDDLSAKMAVLYFDGKFDQLAPKERGALISGLTARLALLSTPTWRSTFCQPDDSKGAFKGFHETMVNNPGIIVFAVPELESSLLCRLLGIAFLRLFQTQQLHRSSTRFKGEGGNVDRLVFNFIDECWAYMNKKVAAFTSVARESKTSCVFLTQGIDQVEDSYLQTFLGNFRTRVLLSVSDEKTSERFSKLLGDEEVEVEVQSVGESLQDVRQGILGNVGGRSRGMSASTSVQRRRQPRYSPISLIELGEGRAVLQAYDGNLTAPPVTLAFNPCYRLPAYLYHPLTHPDVRCDKANKAHPHHAYRRDGRGLKCEQCGRALDERSANELHEYKVAHPQFFTAKGHG